ncbi:MAG: pseudouridine synthase [Minisyncoccia bacterium]
MIEKKAEYPMRINKYLAGKGVSTRKGVDKLIEAGKVIINGRKAVLGDKVLEIDKVEVTGKPNKNQYKYFAYYKPKETITQQKGQKELDKISGVPGLFPIGRLDKDSEGLMILTNDGRITDRLLSPDKEHEKEYVVKTTNAIKPLFVAKAKIGIDIGDCITKPCQIFLEGEKGGFRIILKEGKKHQIRRMTDAYGIAIESLKRIRIMNILLGNLKPNEHREITGEELEIFLKSLGL